jgi:hypothetical protein
MALGRIFIMPAYLAVFKHPQVILMLEIHQPANAHNLVIVLHGDKMICKLLGLKIFDEILYIAARGNMSEEIMLPSLMAHDLKIDQKIPAGAVNGGNDLP